MLTHPTSKSSQPIKVSSSIPEEREMVCDPSNTNYSKNMGNSLLDPLGYNRGQLADQVEVVSKSSPKLGQALVVDGLVLNLKLDFSRKLGDMFKVIEDPEDPIFLRFLENGEYGYGTMVTTDAIFEDFMCTGDMDLYIKHTGSGTKRHKHRMELVYKNHPFGTITAFSRLPGIAKDCVQLRIENRILYTDGYVKDIEHICRLLGVEDMTVSSIDIAHDSCANIEVLEFIEDWHFSKGRNHEALGRNQTGRAKLQPYFDSKHNLTGFDWGSKASIKRLTVYDKTLELNSNGGKDYIKDFHTENGIEGRVVRAELKLKLKALNKIKDFEWRKISDMNYLGSVFLSQIKSWFEFVPTTGPKDRHKRERVKLFDFMVFGSKYLDKSRREPSNGVYSAKMTVKRLHLSNFQKPRTYLFDSLWDIVARYGIQEWYEDGRQKHWEKEYIIDNPHLYLEKFSDSVKEDQVSDRVLMVA